VCHADRVKRLALAVATVFGTGCLSSTHVIPHDDLVALAQTPPEQRGERVRVIQGFSGADEPPSAPHVGVGVGVIVTDPVPVTPVGAPNPYNTAKGSKEQAKWWIVVAAITGVVLAATEGMRWDGWVAMHPEQPVHLYGPYGEYTWVPLSRLDVQTALWASKAFVREGEGPPFRELERAPLNRRGGTYSILLGAGDIASQAPTSQLGFMAHIELGFAPVHTLVAQLDVGLGWAQNAVGGTVFENRDAVELQLFLPSRTIHPGVYGEIGLGFRQEDLPPFSNNGVSLYAAGGGIVQLEITARLALTVRGGVASLYNQIGPELVGGVSIY
jgi:hypothetical protein